MNKNYGERSIKDLVKNKYPYYFPNFILKYLKLKDAKRIKKELCENYRKSLERSTLDWHLVKNINFNN